MQFTSYIISFMVYDISYKFNLVDIGTSATFSYLLVQDISEMVIFTIGSGSLFWSLWGIQKFSRNSIIRFRCSVSRAFHIIKNYWNIIFHFSDIHTFIYFLPCSTLIVVKFTYIIHYFWFYYNIHIKIQLNSFKLV